MNYQPPWGEWKQMDESTERRSARIPKDETRYVSGMAYNPYVLMAEGECEIYETRRIPSLSPLDPRVIERRKLTTGLRFKVLSAAKFTCRYCGRKAPEVELHVDHIHPISRGGTTTLENLAAACSECNIGKFDTILGVL